MQGRSFFGKRAEEFVKIPADPTLMTANVGGAAKPGEFCVAFAFEFGFPADKKRVESAYRIGSLLRASEDGEMHNVIMS